MTLPDSLIGQIQASREVFMQRDRTTHPEISEINFLTKVVSAEGITTLINSGELKPEDLGELYEYVVQSMVEAAFRAMLGDRDEDNITKRNISVFYSPYPSLVEEDMQPKPDFIPFMIRGFHKYIDKLSGESAIQVPLSKFTKAIDEFGEMAEGVYERYGLVNGNRENLLEELAILHKRIIDSF